MAKELFLEIGTEEIPAGFLPKAMADMESLIRTAFETAHIGFGAIRTLATPRRLALAVAEVAEEQPTLHSRALGPAKAVAFDAQGRPTRAAEGFARGQGMTVEQLTVVETEKGLYLCAEKEQAGRPTAELLTEILPRLLGAIQRPGAPAPGQLHLRELDEAGAVESHDGPLHSLRRRGRIALRGGRPAGGDGHRR